MIDQFYPTPRALAAKMAAKIQGCPDEILEPSAGAGDLVDYLTERDDRWRHGHKKNLAVMEIDRNRRATLRGKGYRVIDNDFLAWSGPDKFDLIIMNPPFAEGDKHLWKAIDVMYSGQIICLLNAETLKNPYTGSRKALVRQLEEMGAEIEFIKDAFVDAERKTGVEIAMVSIVVERKVEEDLFAGCDDQAAQCEEQVGENYEVATGKHIEDMVAEYNQIVGLAMETIVNYYRNHKKVGKYIGLNSDPDKYYRSAKDLTNLVKATTNSTVRRVRKDFWLKTLDLPEVKSRMTAARLKEFEGAVHDRANMDFTASNIRGFLLNLIAGYNDTLTQAVLEVFDRFTVKHCWDEGGIFGDNVHYFNGWKTNKAFKVGKKVIVPVYGGHGNGPFIDWMRKDEWKLDYRVATELLDIDVVMNYFDGCPHYRSITKALEEAFAQGQNRNIESTYFRATAFKKGTLHLTFKDENILRRFNVAACLGKGWLPMDYGEKPYQDMSADEQAVVDTFETKGAEEYTKHLGQAVFEKTWSQPLMLEAT